MNEMQKPFDNLKVRQAINYAINKEALCKVAFAGYAVPALGPVPLGSRLCGQVRSLALRSREGARPIERSRVPERLREHFVVCLQQHHLGKGNSVRPAAIGQVGIKVQVRALETGENVEKVLGAQDPKTAPVRMYYVGWSSSTGEADWALRPLLASESWPPKLFNVGYYKNDQVDADIQNALATTERAKKTQLYNDAQKRIWDDAAWAFLVTENLVYARSKNLTGIYVMPDASFEFSEISMK